MIGEFFDEDLRHETLALFRRRMAQIAAAEVTCSRVALTRARTARR